MDWASLAGGECSVVKHINTGLWSLRNMCSLMINYASEYHPKLMQKKHIYERLKFVIFAPVSVFKRIAMV